MNARAWARRGALGLLAAALALAAALGGCEPAQRDLTILLVEYQGPEARPSADRLAGELADQKLPDVFVVEGPDYAAVCVGRYRTWNDTKAREMMGRVRRIRDARGQYPFQGVMLVPVPEPAPKTSWALEEAPGVYSLYVAGWESLGRKENAQAYAANLRKEGWEAYVYHGPRLSMVTIGAFGPDLFDDASKIGRPGVKPTIVHPKALEILRAFPYLRIEDQATPVPSTAIRIPGREAAASTRPPLPKALYRVTLSLVSTETGVAAGRGQASGVAQHEREIGPLVEALVKQLVASLGPAKRVRIGQVGLSAASPEAAELGADRAAADALAAALQRAAQDRRLLILSPEATRQVLDAAGLAEEMVRKSPRLARGLKDLDFVLVGSVTATKM
ncbi:MAG TPA: hypothetical protein VMW52_08700 [Phycisphaerae bacterium]|nr:hypothetical protein [Phycisphaerae bacterium]